VKTIRDESPERVLIQVIDDGRGIEKRDVTRIFDPFYTTKPTGEGTGLGLSVSYGIIKNHGGHIHVESQPGMGTTFTVELPVPVKL
jgi:signal transduction histidine kinase